MPIPEVLMPSTVRKASMSAAIAVTIGSLLGYAGSTFNEPPAPKRVTIQHGRPDAALVYIDTIIGTRYFATLQCPGNVDPITNIKEIQEDLAYKVARVPHEIIRNTSGTITRQVEKELSALGFCSLGFSSNSKVAVSDSH